MGQTVSVGRWEELFDRWVYVCVYVYVTGHGDSDRWGEGEFSELGDHLGQNVGEMDCSILV